MGSMGGALVGSGSEAPEAAKHDINFALRITLVNAYCTIIITFVIEFS